MAVPIGSTPVLQGEESAKWLKKVQEEEGKKLGLVPTPRLEELRQEILADARRNKK
ncbi:MAG: hypothetical protein WCJ75_16310 [Desulfomonile sp.]|jgi:hypothetical protein